MEEVCLKTSSALKSSLTIHIWSIPLKITYLFSEFFTTDLEFKINRRKEPYTHSLDISNVYELHSSFTSFLTENWWILGHSRKGAGRIFQRLRLSSTFFKWRTQTCIKDRVILEGWGCRRRWGRGEGAMGEKGMGRERGVGRKERRKRKRH